MKKYTGVVQGARNIARQNRAQDQQLELPILGDATRRRDVPQGDLLEVTEATTGPGRLRAAEFFAGIGLVRVALEGAGVSVDWANDIEPSKWAMYRAHFGQSGVDHYVLGDVCAVRGESLPDVEIATASFPCTDLSLAGNRAGLAGIQSGMFWEFARVLDEMGERRPEVVLLENVPGFATSHGGRDLHAAIARLNGLGYVCDLVAIDARAFVPQSRVRMFVIGTQGRVAPDDAKAVEADPLRPPWIDRFVDRNPCLEMQRFPLPPLAETPTSLSQVVERVDSSSDLWWTGDRLASFLGTLPPLHQARLKALQASGTTTWRTAYRRTRKGDCVWEVRPDEIAGCLRTARGGSSKQALVEITPDEVRVRWMTPREYAALQGAPSFRFAGSVTDNKALYGFGDAVCVPVIQWLAEHYLVPAAQECHNLAYA